MSDVRIACVGDIMCGDSFYAVGRGVAASLKKWENRFLDEEIVDYLKGHDICMCNVECVLSDIGANAFSLRKTQMRGRPRDAELLSNWGFNVANVANNHIFEQGQKAAIDTVRNLYSAGIEVIGAGNGGDFKEGIGGVQLSVKDTGVLLLGVCLRQEKYAFHHDDWNALLTVVREKAKQNKAIIVSIHWGEELIDRPSVTTKKQAQQLIEAGATAIIGHHPHVVQGIDASDQRLIAYSLGNFIFNGFLPDTTWSIILSLTLSGNRVREWSFRPVEKDSEHRPHFYKAIGQRNLDAEIERRIRLACILHDNDLYEREYRCEVQKLKENASRQLRRFLQKNFWSYSPVFWPQLMMRPVRRRLGAW